MRLIATRVLAQDGSTISIAIRAQQVSEGAFCDITIVEPWEDMRALAGELLELIKEAEANSDPS